MPSLQWIIATSFPTERVKVIGINSSSSVDWLRTYRNQKGLSYAFVFDTRGDCFSRYQVGGSSGNQPPSYIIIDGTGVVRFRSDKEFNRFQEMKTVIERLL